MTDTYTIVYLDGTTISFKENLSIEEVDSWVDINFELTSYIVIRNGFIIEDGT